MARLLAHLVQGVHDARVRVVPLQGQLEGESRHEDGLELDPGVDDRRHLLTGQPDQLVGSELEPQPGHAEQVRWYHRPGTHLAGHLEIRLDRPAQRDRRQPLDLDVRLEVWLQLWLQVPTHSSHGSSIL